MKQLMIALAATVAFAGVQSGFAEEHESKKVTVPSLSSLQDVVNAVAYYQREVDEHIASKELDELHGYAYAASDSAGKAKDFASSLSEEKRKELDERLAKIKSIAKQLDKYGDAGKVDESKQFSGKLKEESEAVQKLLGFTASKDWKPAGAAEDSKTSGTAEKKD